MSVAYVGTFTTSGLAALDKASARYLENVKSGNWDKMEEVEGRPGDMKISSASLKNSYVTIDGVRMTYKQAYTTKKFREQGGTAYGSRVGNGYRMQQMTSGNYAMAVRPSTAQAHIPATKVNKNTLQKMKMSDKSAKTVRNKLTAAQKQINRSKGGKLTASGKSKVESYKNASTRAVGMKVNSGNKSSGRKTGLNRNKKSSYSKNKKKYNKKTKYGKNSKRNTRRR